MKTIIIQGSSNSTGNTSKIVNRLQQKIGADILDLANKHILPFDYQFENQSDDFSSTIHHVLDYYDTLIFATPVYWYTMSGILKDFIDRFTDGLIHDQSLGRKFEGKHMAALACGSSKSEIEAFFVPFQKSATYLKMNYLGNTHLWLEATEEESISPAAEQRLHSFSTLFT